MIEGILVRKTPFQDRHLIGDLVLRSGKKQGVLFFGGMGGGKKIKPNNLEIGKLYKITFQNPPKGDLIQTKEWQIKWSHENIRYNYWSFLNLNFIAEICSYVSLPCQDSLDQSDMEQQGLFNVLSNGLFYLENNKINQNDFNFLNFFLGKLMIELGIFPFTNNCIDCDSHFIKNQPTFLNTEKGGFICSNCPMPNEETTINCASLIESLNYSKNITWKNFQPISNSFKTTIDHFKLLNQYINFQLNFDYDSLKTLKSFF